MTNEKRLEDLLADDMIEMAKNAAQTPSPPQVRYDDRDKYVYVSDQPKKKIFLGVAAILAAGVITAIAYFGIRTYARNDSQGDASSDNGSNAIHETADPGTFREYSISGEDFSLAYLCNKNEMVVALTELLQYKSGGNNLDFQTPDEASVEVMLDELTDGELGPFTPGPYKPLDPVQNPEIQGSSSIDWHDGTYNFEFGLRHSNYDTSFSIETQNLAAANRFSDALKCS